MLNELSSVRQLRKERLRDSGGVLVRKLLTGMKITKEDSATGPFLAKAWDNTILAL